MALNRFIAAVISFFLFPFIVKHVGKEIYGVYLIIMTVTGYFGLLDLGVMSALTKYVSEYNGKGDRDMIGKIINASFSFYVMIGAVVSLLLFLCMFYFTHIFNIDPQNIEVAKQLFLFAAISALLVWPLNTFRGTIQGLNLWAYDATINIGVQALNALAAFSLLNSGYGIVQLFIVSQGLTIIGSLVLLYVAKQRIGFKISFPYLDRDTFKLIFNFSIFVFITSLIYIFIFQIHNIIIGYYMSISAITIYAVAFNLQNYFRAINSTLGAPPWTVASEMEGRRDYEGQKKLLLTGTRYMSAIFIPITLIMFFFAEPFINNWMGPGFHESILPARIIILFWIFNGTLELAAGMLTAKGIVKEPLYVHATIAILNIVIGISLIRVIGITAIALGLTLSMILIGFPLLLRLSLKSLGVSFVEYFNKAIKNNLWLYLMVIILSMLVLKYLYPKNILLTLIELAAIYSVSILVYFAFGLNKNEKQEIIKLIGMETIADRIPFMNGGE